MACSKQKGSGKEIMVGWLLHSFRVSKKKCRQCPHPQHSLMHLRTWPSSRWLMFKSSELWDASSNSWEKAAAPLAYLCRKNKQAVKVKLWPHPGMWSSTGRESGQLVKTSGEEEGSLLWASSTFAVDQPTFSKSNPHPLLSQTQKCLVFCKPNFAEILKA